MSQSESVNPVSSVENGKVAYPATPQHEKLRSLQRDNQTIGAFLEWLRAEKGFEICELEPLVGENGRKKNWQDYVPLRKSIQDLLADYFEIDQEALEDEKRAILDHLAAQHA